MATTRFPDSTDAGITQAAWQAMNSALRGGDAIGTSGYDLSDGGAGQLDAAGGTAYASDAEVTNDATISKTLSVGDRYVWLTPAGAIGETANTTPPNTDDLFLGYIVVGAGPSISTINRWSHASQGNESIFDSRSTNWMSGTSVGTSQPTVTIAEVQLEPGVYWFRAQLMGQGGAFSASQTITWWWDVTTATDYEIHGAVFIHSGGLTDLWFDASGSHGSNTPANNDPEPTTIIGRLALADSGALRFRVSTSAHHTVTAGSSVQVLRIQ